MTPHEKSRIRNFAEIIGSLIAAILIGWLFSGCAQTKYNPETGEFVVNNLAGQQTVLLPNGVVVGQDHSDAIPAISRGAATITGINRGAELGGKLLSNRQANKEGARILAGKKLEFDAADQAAKRTAEAAAAQAAFQ